MKTLKLITAWVVAVAAVIAMGTATGVIITVLWKEVMTTVVITVVIVIAIWAFSFLNKEYRGLTKK